MCPIIRCRGAASCLCKDRAACVCLLACREASLVQAAARHGTAWHSHSLGTVPSSRCSTLCIRKGGWVRLGTASQFLLSSWTKVTVCIPLWSKIGYKVMRPGHKALPSATALPPWLPSTHRSGPDTLTRILTHVLSGQAHASGAHLHPCAFRTSARVWSTLLSRQHWSRAG